jgi:hypothetical protein
MKRGPQFVPLPSGKIGRETNKEGDYFVTREVDETTGKLGRVVARARRYKPTSPQIAVYGPQAVPKLHEKMYDVVVKGYDDAQQAMLSLPTIQKGRKLLDSGMITGFGANQILGVGKALQRFGFDQFSDPIANTEAYASSMGKMVGQIIKQFGAGTGLSDADREYAERMAGAKIGLTEKSLRKILDIAERGLRNSIEAHNKRAAEVMSKPGMEGIPFNLMVDVPEMAPGKETMYQTPEDVKNAFLEGRLTKGQAEQILIERFEGFE